jgi:hypothetical protein
VKVAARTWTRWQPSFVDTAIERLRARASAHEKGKIVSELGKNLSLKYRRLTTTLSEIWNDSSIRLSDNRQPPASGTGQFSVFLWSEEAATPCRRDYLGRLCLLSSMGMHGDVHGMGKKKNVLLRFCTVQMTQTCRRPAEKEHEGTSNVFWTGHDAC